MKSPIRFCSIFGSVIALTVALIPALALAYDPAQPGHSGFTVTPPTGQYLMSFHTCVADCDGKPDNHSIRLAESSDGVSWTQLAGWQAYRGSVPDLFRRGDTVYMTGAGISKIDVKTGKVTAHSFSATKANGTDAMPRDICFIGQMEDGRLIIAYVPPMSETANVSQFKVSYAIEKVGSDGTAYIYGGDLITIEKSALPVMGEPTDPDVFFNGSQWVLYVSLGANVVSYTSASMTGPFINASQVLVANNAGGVPAGLRLADGSGVMTFVNTTPMNGATTVRRAISTSGISAIATSAFTSVVSGSTYASLSAESPGLASNNQGIACSATCSGVSATTSTIATSSATTPAPTKSITCVKGKITKKFLATKCPAGFKKK